MARARLAASRLAFLLCVVACACLAFGWQPVAAQSGSPSSSSASGASSGSGQQTDSVAEAARKVREAKKNATKAAKVLTEDDLRPPRPADAATQSSAGPAVSQASQENASGVAGGAASAPAGAAATAPVAQTSEESTQAKTPARTGGLAMGAPARDSFDGPSPQDVAAAAEADRLAKKSPKDDPVKDTDSAELKAAKADLAVAEADLEAAKEELALEQDNVYRNPDYAHDKTGQAKLDALKQQVADRQAEVDTKRTKVTEAAAKSGEAKP